MKLLCDVQDIAPSPSFYKRASRPVWWH